jgi:hypothetical protein
MREFTDMGLPPPGSPRRHLAEIAVHHRLCCGIAEVEGRGLLLYVARRDSGGGGVSCAGLGARGAVAGIGRRPLFVAWRAPRTDVAAVAVQPEPDAHVLAEGVWLGVFHRLPAGYAEIVLQAQNAAGQPVGDPASLTVRG